MKIKNFIVENKELILEYLERTLCQKGISYARIDNEIHFQNQIIRLYDIENDLEEIIRFVIGKMDMEKREMIRLINVLKNRRNILLENPETYYENERKYQRMNKNIQKQQSHQVNQKIKAYR